MKKVLGILLVVLVLPLCAHAGYLGYGDLNVVASGPTGGNYYLDYDGTVQSSDFGYTFSDEEVFCVSREDGNGGNYDFYTIDSSLSNFSKLSQAAWIADNWMSFGSLTDDLKGEAQKAVWKIMGFLDIVGSSGTDLDIYNEAVNHEGYVTKNWLWAVSPSMTRPCGTNYQDYLTPYTAVPEPGSLLLIGFGLLGVAGIKKRLVK